MEEKRLDFSAPLLSVRRLSSTVAASDRVNSKRTSQTPPRRQESLPLYKPDCELGEVTKPAAVPFLWERIPGRRKGKCEVQSHTSNNSRLPPARVLNVKRNVSGERSDVQNVFKQQTEMSSPNDYALLLESLKEGINTNVNSNLETQDDTYSDALDTLSTTGSFSLNCSVSGLSSYDGPDVKLSGTFSVDPQTRDFMMSRFLPAAKALVLETPQNIPRKQPVATQQPRQVKQVVTQERTPLFQQYESVMLSHYGQYADDVENENREEELVDPGKKLSKTCGLLSRLHVKNSLHHLKPVPGMKSRVQSPVSSTGEIRRLTRTAYSGPLVKHAYDAPQKKFHSGVLPRGLHEVESKLMGESNQSSYSNDTYKIDVSSPSRRSRGGGISPYRNEAPRSCFQEGARFLGLPKAVEKVKPKESSPSKRGNYWDVSSCETRKEKSGSASPVVEKTLYVDSVYSIQNAISNSGSSQGDTLGNSSREKFEAFAESKGMEETPTAKSSVQDKRSINHLEEGRATQPEGYGSSDASSPYDACISGQKAQAGRIKGLGLDGDLDQESICLEYSVNPSGSSDRSNEHTIKTDEQGSHTAGSLQSPQPPPLPKSPSESWLWRALPFIHLRNPFSHSPIGGRFHSKTQNKKISSADTKWETIVKTSNIHHDHTRYSEELIRHVSQHS